MANLCSSHRHQAIALGSRPALRFRDLGLFRNLSWADYRRQADATAMGLLQLGIEPGDRVAILAENSAQWLVTDHGILSTGAATMPMHAPLSAEQVEFQLSHSEARGVFVSGQFQADKIAQVIDNLPHIEFVISFEPVEFPAATNVLTFAGLQSRGWQARGELFDTVLSRETALDEDSLATIIYTSGTTGNPKGVMLTHGNLLSNAAAMHDMSGIGLDDQLLSWLPYSHIYARTVDHYLSNLSGAVLVLSASIDDVVTDLKAIQPTWFTAVPRFYEKIWASVESLDPEPRTDVLRGIFGPNIKQLTSGGAPLPKHVCEAFFDSSFALLEGYGLTESSPVICFNRLDSYRIGSVGQAIQDVEVSIADDGEVLTRGPHVMRGYWKNDQATNETIVDGWLHTGDVGELDTDQFLSITDRKKDLIITSSGKNVAPSTIERALVSDPLIDQAVVYGDNRKFISALVVPNLDLLTKLAKDAGFSVEIEGDFIVTDDVHVELEKRIDSLMHPFSRPEQIRRFLVLARPFALEEDEMTATMKVRRRHIIEKYRAELDGLYDKP
jgi:long-chain acyl-CoA synthetase